MDNLRKSALIQYKLVNGWAEIFTDKLRLQLKQNNIGKTGALSRSIQKQLVANGFDIIEVFVRFHLYGRFVDMGVGNGVKAYERTSNNENTIGAERYGANVRYNKRKAKRWFNKKKTAEIYRLRELLAKGLGDAVVENFKNEFASFTEYSVRL